MKRYTLIAAAAALMLLGNHGSAQTTADTAVDDGTIQIAVGQTGRGYEKRGLQIAETLEQRGLDAETVNYEGSDDISLAVCSGEADIGIMQIDALYTRAKEGCALKVIGTYGEEFAYLLFPPDSDFSELHDLGKGNKLLVDTLGSGSDLFWRTIRSIETGPKGNKSEWAQITPVNDIATLAETMADTGEIDGALLVLTPTSAELKRLIDAGWYLGEIDDKDINDEVFNDTSLYPRAEAEIEGTGGFFSGNESNDTYVVRSFIVANPDFAADRQTYASVVQAVNR